MFLLMIYTDGGFGLLVSCDGWIHWALDENSRLLPLFFPSSLYALGYSHSFCLVVYCFVPERLVSCLLASAALHHDPFAYSANVLALLVFVPSIYESD